MYPFGAPRWGCPWRVHQASVLGCVRCGVLRVWTRSLTRPVSRTARVSTGDSAGAPGLFRVDTNTAPCGSEDVTPGSRACVRVRAVLAGSGGLAPRARFGAPHLFLWPFLLLSLSARPPPGWSCLACVVSGFFSLPSSAPLLSPAFRVFWPWVPWALASCGPSPPPLLFVFFPSLLSPACFFVLLFFRGFFSLFFFFLRAVLAVRCRAGVSWVLGRVGVRCCGPCASAGAGVRLRSVVRWPLPVPPPFVLLRVVLRVPGGAVLAVLLFPYLPLVAAVWCCPPEPSGAWRGGFFFCVRFLLVVPPSPPSAAGCAVLCCGLSCVVWCGAAVCGVFRVVSVVVWRACVLAPCCAGSCCAVVVVLCFRALLRSLLVSFFFLRCSLPFRGAAGCFCFCALLVRCCAGAPASLLSVRCSLAPVALAGVLCCCLLCLRDCCWAWLSSVVSWWVLVAPGVVFRWCAVVCPWVPCCAVLLRVVPPGVVWFRCALFGAVVWCVVSWGAVRRPWVLCLPAPCFVVSRRAVCVLLWCFAAWCCSPLCFVPCASRGVVLCVPCPLPPVRCCCGALLSLGALLPCAVPRDALLPCGAVVSRPAALFGLFPAVVWFLLLEKPLQNLFKIFLFFFENKIKLYTPQRTHTRTLAGSKTMSGPLPYMSPRVGGGVVAGIALVVAVSWT